MARKKVPLRYIGNDSARRRRTYQTRRKNLMKKAGELRILCNTKACVLVYDQGASVPDVVYPSHAEAAAILNRYKATPNMVQFKKTVSHEEFLTKCVAKFQYKADKLRREREDRDIRALLHKAMLGGDLSAEEVARVGSKSGEIHKSLRERIAKTTRQLPVFQPQGPNVTGGAHMGPPPVYQAPPQQQAGWQPSIFQPQAPYITDSVHMGTPPMYQAPPPQQGWQPPVFQPQAPNVTGSVDMGPPPMYQAPPPQQGWQPLVFQPQAPNVTGSVDMGPPPLYEMPPQQEGWQPQFFQAPNVADGVDMVPPQMYQAPPQQQEGWQPPAIQPQVPNVTGNVDMGPPKIYQAPPQQQEGWQPPVFQPQAPNVTGSVDMVPLQMYQAPHQQQEGWRDTVRSEGDHNALDYNGYSTGGHDGGGTNSSASLPIDDMMQFLDDMESGLQ
ncbi:hypothetical protein ZWY2020_009661 [Hordeum vulgare]|nr:hypothetical protein ZWY2020_009661 [Hordeum vulgare]